MRIAIIAIFLAIVCACSTRRAHEPTVAAPPSPDAININTATVEEIERLPSIGRKTAEAVVEFRDANGPFRRPEHVMLVSGISERRFVEIRHLLKTE